MDLYEEFFRIIKIFEHNEISYAVVGGIAMAFHDKPRFTKDINLLIIEEHLPKLEKSIQKIGYFKSTDPHKFLKTDLLLHRFVKTKAGDHILLDVLVGKIPRYKLIIANAIDLKWKDGIVKIVNKVDLIWLKELRNSDLDKIDIKKLENDQN